MSQPVVADPTIITPGLLRGWPLELDESGDKNQRGTVLVIGGSRKTPGAVLLAGVAALRAGAGKLTVAAPETTAVALGVAVPEAGVIGLVETVSGSLGPDSAQQLQEQAAGAGAVLIGPGLADVKETTGLLEHLLPTIPSDVNVVLDAMTLGAIGTDPALIDPVRGRVVLTPNRAEAAVLLGEEPSIHDLQVAGPIAERYDAAISYGNAVAAPDGRQWLDQTGHVGLGTSGSGDVLAGLIAGVLARSRDCVQAACWGTHLHGASGDRLAARVGRLGFLAREILDEAPRVLAELST
jgi:ADP-dependent NAD(P)H-hydrate dehydratase